MSIVAMKTYIGPLNYHQTGKPHELFLEFVERDIFHPDNAKFKCNLTTDERNAMRDLVNNKDIVIRIQDKGSRFVLLNSTDYVDKMEEIISMTTRVFVLYMKIPQIPFCKEFQPGAKNGCLRER